MKRWTPDELETMAAMRRGGHTFSEIARACGVSRSVVCGLANRNPDLFPQRATPKAAAPKPPGAGRPGRRLRPGRFGNAGRPKLIPIEHYDTQHMQIPGTTPVAFVECSAFQCRLVLTRGAERAGPYVPCCGQPVVEGEAYCAAHLKLMYRNDSRERLG